MENNDPAPTSEKKFGFHVDPRFINLRPLAHGGNAPVYSATDSECDKEVAIKKLSFGNRHSCKYALRELRLMRRLQHENVVTVYEVLGSNGLSLEKGGNVNLNINEISSVYIVQELLHTDLHQLIQQKQLSQDHVRLFTYQLLRGLKYIHSANVLHRDLKPMNLLINVEDLVLKIADFGLSRVVDPEYSHKGFLTDNVGTCWYRSPELIISPREYTKAIDLWSVGCILAEMFIGKPIFPGAHEMDQIGLILETVSLSDNEWNTVTQILPSSFIRNHTRVPERPLSDCIKSVDIDALDLVEKLLVFEPSLRLTAEEALAHPYLQQFRCVEDEPIVLTPFHIEHEVDDLSPKTARRMISNEMSKSLDTCGSQMECPSIPNTAQRPTEVLVAVDPPHGHPIDLHRPVSSAKPRAVNICIQGDSVQDKNRQPANNKVAVDKNKRTPSPLIEECAERIDNDRDINDLRMHRKSIPFPGSVVACPFGRSEIDGNLNSFGFSQDCMESRIKNLRIIVDLPDEENKKDQSSLKECKDEGSEKCKESKDLDETNVERLVVKVDDMQPKFRIPKDNDILNQERQLESPRTRSNSGFEEIDFVRLEKERLRQLGLAEKLKNGKKKKKNRRNNRSNSGEEGQDFDTLYRLPTEHLTRHRNSICGKDKHVRKVEDQLRLHEELNERRKMVEIEREHNYGAVGGYPDVEESIVAQDSGVAFENRNASPTSEHSRDSSPTNEDVVRRF
ncbi:mitogen-activated protein kinase 4-like [Dreissena polymorpha]|uniref:Protein kinase domain-containing protein n=1 Tax=Dreissena polymorpha TaxID=45954 RepID=A0A9D4HAK8_DREPO|nr:mitogen-activated protein kinase 4-like [Dreissena polymorpha]KAH3713426.1 hypothetical protein DPMN_073219 [Dreissena polymorpha]